MDASLQTASVALRRGKTPRMFASLALFTNSVRKSHASLLCFDKMDIDVWDVVKAADSKPFGFMAFYPGPGVGGHCIRVDPYYLTWKAREHGLSTRFIELAGEVNIAMPKYCVHPPFFCESQRLFVSSGSSCRS